MANRKIPRLQGSNHMISLIRPPRHPIPCINHPDQLLRRKAKRLKPPSRTWLRYFRMYPSPIRVPLSIHPLGVLSQGKLMLFSWFLISNKMYVLLTDTLGSIIFGFRTYGEGGRNARLGWGDWCWFRFWFEERKAHFKGFSNLRLEWFV